MHRVRKRLAGAASAKQRLIDRVRALTESRSTQTFRGSAPLRAWRDRPQASGIAAHLPAAGACDCAALSAAGCAHRQVPSDGLRRQEPQEAAVVRAALAALIRGVYPPNRNMDLAQVMISDIGIGLITPRRPLEASGIRAMKVALNGVTSLSILDGSLFTRHRTIRRFSFALKPCPRAEAQLPVRMTMEMAIR